ncbi:MAG: hypothetical protein LQ340_006960 [Diploschistes diacapsis]|nr:MAG: hypothetical protein LQ340_006960 [Diploschistes diacapsis]
MYTHTPEGDGEEREAKTRMYRSEGEVLPLPSPETPTTQHENPPNGDRRARRRNSSGGSAAAASDASRKRSRGEMMEEGEEDGELVETNRGRSESGAREEKRARRDEPAGVVGARMPPRHVNVDGANGTAQGSGEGGDVGDDADVDANGSAPAERRNEATARRHGAPSSNADPNSNSNPSSNSGTAAAAAPLIEAGRGGLLSPNLNDDGNMNGNGNGSEEGEVEQ